MDRYKRLIDLISINNFNKITNTCVCVIGCGAVGGYAIEMLARSGIGTIIIIDNDIIDITNLNRQLFTNINNIGNKKVNEIKKILSTYSTSNIITLDIFLDNSNIDILDNYNIDYIIDACDTINTKKLVIDKCLKDNIKLISSMGTGNKLNPSLFKIMDIRDTKYDRVAKILRKYVKDKGYKEKIMVVSSDEEIIHSKTINTISYMPSISGILCASYVINDIIDKDNIY